MRMAGISLPNEASVRFHEHVGFQPVGIYRHVGFKHGQWHDVGWWSLDLAPLPQTPVQPRAVSELRGHTRVASYSRIDQSCEKRVLLFQDSRERTTNYVSGFSIEITQNAAP